MTALTIEGLNVTYQRSQTAAVDDFACVVEPGEVVGIIGESGSGKSTVALASMGLLPDSAEVTAGQFAIDGDSVVGATEADFLKIRGKHAAMIFQEPMTALNPTMTVRDQIAESVLSHQQVTKAQAREKAVELLELVQMPDARKRANDYPHQLSGGQRQRVLIAIAMAARPNVLIADEPTTALDVTIQADILKLLLELKDEIGMGILFITHDLGVVANVCDRVVVMYHGEIVEHGTTEQVLRNPQHEYTQALLGCIPRVTTKPRSRLQTVIPGAHVGEVASLENEVVDADLLSFRNVDFTYPGTSTQTLTDVSLSARTGRTLGIVGESGSGKSTLAKLTMGLLKPSSGEIVFDGNPVAQYSRRALVSYRRDVQMVFQDPNGSFDPRLPLRKSLAEPLKSAKDISKVDAKRRTEEALSAVGFEMDVLDRLPSEFSGGQRQRLALARALVTRPKLIVLDEPTSALDVSVQAQVLNLLVDLQREFGMTYVFISHNMAVVRHMSHDLVVMKNGRIVEQGDAMTVLESPEHEYTQTLLDSIPNFD